MDAFLARHDYPGGKTATELLGRSAKRSRRNRRDQAEARRRARGRARPGQRAFGDRRPGQRAGKADPRCASCPSRRDDLRAAVSHPGHGDLPGDADRRVGRRAGALPHRGALAADAGKSPVAVESGKRQVAIFRRACDTRLRVAIATLANSTRRWHPWAREVYRKARERGQDHAHALRTLGRAWVRVLWRCWVNRVPYDPSLHGNIRSAFRSRGVDIGRLGRPHGSVMRPPASWPCLVFAREERACLT